MHKETVTYKARLVGLTSAERKLIDATIKRYREAVSYLIGTLDMEWERIKSLPTANHRLNYAERLVHYTEKHPHVLYDDFDILFPNFPSYLRRAAIQEAIGALQAYKTNFRNSSNPGNKGTRPH